MEAFRPHAVEENDQGARKVTQGFSSTVNKPPWEESSLISLDSSPFGQNGIATLSPSSASLAPVGCWNIISTGALMRPALADLKPQEIWKHFDAIASIP